MLTKASNIFLQSSLFDRYIKPLSPVMGNKPGAGETLWAKSKSKFTRLYFSILIRSDIRIRGSNAVTCSK
jgi:hypothetical protein